jgi:hypothetical protein
MSVLTKILKAPLIILVITSFAASIYAAINKIQGITIAVPIILGLILLCYLIAVIVERKVNQIS